MYAKAVGMDYFSLQASELIIDQAFQKNKSDVVRMTSLSADVRTIKNWYIG